jgi:Holliday junction resolvase
MTAKNKRRGNVFEQEVVKAAKEKGFDAARAWGSDGRALGEHPEVDVMIGTWKVQCKRRKKLPAWLVPSEHVDVQMVREDRGRPYVIMPLDLFFAFIDAANDYLGAGT